MKRVREAVFVSVAAAALAIALTWPIAARFGSAGRVDSGDGRYSVWNVAWVAHALTTNPRTLYDANIFFPHDNALAYSEANLVAGVLAIPVWVLTHNAYAATNWAILCAFALAAICMYALVKHLTGDVAAAARSGIAYAFCPFAFAHIPHIQLLMTFGPPLALLQLHLLVESPTWRRAVSLGAAVALMALACGYYGLYGGLAVALGGVWLAAWSGRWRTPRYWGLLLVAAAVAFAIVLPFFLPYHQIRDGGFVRSIDDARRFRADWRAYLASSLVLHRWMLPLLESWREVLFPGFLSIGLSIIAVVWALKRKAMPDAPVRPHIVGFYLLLAALAMWASFGPDAGLYGVLYRTVPMLSLLRAPARFGLLVTLALAVAGGVGLASLRRRWTGRWRGALAYGIVGLAVAESVVGGLSLAPAPPVADAYRQLARLPRGPVAEFPYFSGADDRHRQTEYMLMSVNHWQPLINGYSDYIPGEVAEDIGKLTRFPAADAWEVLREHRARYIVIHWDAYPEDERQRVMKETERYHDYMVALVSAPDVSLFQVVKFPNVAAAPAAPGT